MTYSSSRKVIIPGISTIPNSVRNTDATPVNQQQARNNMSRSRNKNPLTKFKTETTTPKKYGNGNSSILKMFSDDEHSN